MLKYVKHVKGDPEYVSLIDDKTKYSEIKKITTLFQLNKHFKHNTIVNQYNTIYNMFKEEYDIQTKRNDLSWINDYFPQLKDFILEKYDKNTENSNTASSYLNTIGKLLLIVDKSKFRESSRIFFLKSKEHKNKASDVIQNKEHESFKKLKDIADQTIERYEKTKKYSDMIDMLIMIMNVYVCPLRLEILNLEISKLKPLMTDHKHTIRHNYLWINDRNIKIIINHDKVSDKYSFKGKPLIIDLDGDDITYENINITNYKKVKNIILETLERYPRYYFLTPENRLNEPLSSSSHIMKLKKLTHNGKMSQNVNRRAFISYYYPRVSKNVQKKIAFHMRHNVSIAKGEYQKNNNDKIKVKIIDIKIPYNTKTDKKNINPDFLRRKIIKYLNDNDGNPQKNTIIKYGLIKGNDGKWS